MKNELISIVIPVYNVEKFIDNCLDSVANQTYKNIEVIIIDDASTDDSSKIYNKYLLNDSRFSCIKLKENKGVSNARNVGMDSSNGDYIIFVDSDDILDNKMIEHLYRNMCKYDAEISISDFYFLYENQTIRENNSINIIEVIENKKKMMDYLFDNTKYAGYMWNKLIKMDLIKKAEIKFNENVKICEDLLFLVMLINKTNKVVYASDLKLYYYRARESSAVAFQYTLKDTTKLIPLKYFIDNQYIYKGLYYSYFVLCSQSLYIMKKENFIGKQEELKKERKKYFKKALLEYGGIKRVEILLWFIAPIYYSKISEKLHKRRKKY